MKKQISILVEEELKMAFDVWCVKNRTSITKSITEFMEEKTK